MNYNKLKKSYVLFLCFTSIFECNFCSDLSSSSIKFLSETAVATDDSESDIFQEIQSCHYIQVQAFMMKDLIALSSGASSIDLHVNKVNSFGKTPLLYALEIKSFESQLFQDRHNIIMAVLIKNHNIDINKQDAEGQSALHVAVLCKKYSVVRQLLAKSDIKVDIQNSVGDSALHDAARISNQKLVKMLVEAGADPFIKNNKYHIVSERTDNLEIKKIIDIAEKPFQKIAFESSTRVAQCNIPQGVLDTIHDFL